MNKVIIRSLLLALLLIILLVLVLFLRGRSPFGKNQSSFASEPKKEITRIEFSDRKDRLSLILKDGSWLVNGRQEARKSGVMFMIRILTEMKIKSPVSPEMLNADVTEKGILPVRVRVFENKRLLKSFYVYKTGSNRYGNIMKIRERGKPFIVHVPGYEGDIGSGFILNELYWQQYIVFNLLPSEISSVTLENLADPAASFSIRRRNYSYIFSDLRTDLSGWDSVRVSRYISYFTWIPFEKYALDINENEKKKIESESPVYRIKVKKTEGEELILTLWRMLNSEKQIIDTDRLWAKTDNREELFIIRYFDIDPVLKELSYFFPE
ncbi:MAG: hypothetical protein MUC93_03220 [Bacteroidales bacterium]|nr:hypothetical protein [Bacteroidales bacterium]